MSISSIQLDAFLAVAKLKSFSKAAQNLNVTKSALSQRIKNLEQDLGLSLFIRQTSGVALTDQGQRLLRYCQMKGSLEEELLEDLRLVTKGEIRGSLRLGAYSSVMRSVIIPSLAPFLRSHPHIQMEFLIRDMAELPRMLQSSEVDFIVMDYRLSQAAVEEHLLGYESYVVIEGTEHKSPADVFLDNSPQDQATEKFFRHQKKQNQIKYRRSYMGDVYGIYDGVTQGLGRAVMSKHLIEQGMPIRIVKGFRPFVLPVTLHHHYQPFYSKLHVAVVDELVKTSPKFLGKHSPE